MTKFLDHDINKEAIEQRWDHTLKGVNNRLNRSGKWLQNLAIEYDTCTERLSRGSYSNVDEMLDLLARARFARELLLEAEIEPHDDDDKVRA